MKIRSGILLLLALLLAALAPGTVRACSEYGEKTEKSCAKAKPDSTDTCHDGHAEDNCPCDHDNGACHCPGCGMVSHSGAASALDIPPALTVIAWNAAVQKLAFYFADHLPEAVYLSIWQPPKLGA